MKSIRQTAWHRTRMFEGHQSHGWRLLPRFSNRIQGRMRDLWERRR